MDWSTATFVVGGTVVLSALVMGLLIACAALFGEAVGSILAAAICLVGTFFAIAWAGKR